MICEACDGSGYRLGSIRPLRFWICAVCDGCRVLFKYMGLTPRAPRQPVLFNLNRQPCGT